MGWFSDFLKQLLEQILGSNGGGNPPDQPDPPETPDTPDTPDQPGTSPSLGIQRASFLFDNAGTRAMNALSYNASEDWTTEVMNRQKKNGDDTVWLYFSNQGDGSPKPTTIYQGLFGGALDPTRVAMVRKRLKNYRDNGFKVVAWLTADDSSTISNASLTVHKQFIDDVHKNFGDLISGYCVGLEMNEDKNRKAMAPSLIAHCKAVTKKNTGVHLLTGSWQEAVQWKADTLYYQAGFGKSASQVKAECASVVGKLKGACGFVLAEYHKSSDSNEAKAIGQAAMTVTGCLGTGNGR